MSFADIDSNVKNPLKAAFIKSPFSQGWFGYEGLRESVRETFSMSHDRDHEDSPWVLNTLPEGLHTNGKPLEDDFDPEDYDGRLNTLGKADYEEVADVFMQVAKDQGFYAGIEFGEYLERFDEELTAQDTAINDVHEKYLSELVELDYLEKDKTETGEDVYFPTEKLADKMLN